MVGLDSPSAVGSRSGIGGQAAPYPVQDDQDYAPLPELSAGAMCGCVGRCRGLRSEIVGTGCSSGKGERGV